MGLFSAPFRGLLRVFEEVARQAEDELYDGDGIRQQLIEIYTQLEAGSISEQEFERREAALVERLEEIDERNRA